MTDRDEDLEAAADQVADAVFALDDVDLNALLDEEVRRLLDAKDELRDVAHRLRQDHRAIDSFDAGD